MRVGMSGGPAYIVPCRDMYAWPRASQRRGLSRDWAVAASSIFTRGWATSGWPSRYSYWRRWARARTSLSWVEEASAAAATTQKVERKRMDFGMAGLLLGEEATPEERARVRTTDS